MSLKSVTTAASCALAGLSSAFAGGWPEMPDPPRAKVEWVSRDVRVNGLPSRIEHFESELSVDEVLAFYRTRWSRSGGPLPRELSAGGWQTIAALQDRYQLVVQARPRQPQGSEGMLSVADLSDMKTDFLPAGWPSWSSVRVLQVTESVDGPKRSHVISMVSDDSFDLNVKRMRDEWLRRGYVLNQQHTNPPASGTRSWIGIFDRPDRTLDVTVAYVDAERRTYITANLVTSSTASNR
ncbi:MAG TPA: hypothetical protein VLA61_08160 [Ideonella sp.]|uniref:hypothetical protein n=1 Tax=Ideonella sp. TaxID=1929293 RepID=UPI002CC66607|nr:hypothetical protein [Ideonella sp.]HSI48226.1 hypothetical protein [Ideonella sp.]